MQSTYTSIREVSHPVYLIMEDATSAPSGSNAIFHLKRAIETTPSNLHANFIISGNKFLSELARSLMKLPGLNSYTSQVHFIQSKAEAYQQIAQLLNTETNPV